MAAPAMQQASTQEESPDLEKNGHAERAQWVLNAPEPPGLWSELLDSVRDKILPGGNNFMSLKNQSGRKHLLSFLQAVFPILVWCQSYTVRKFKNDLLAGLTIASLCIPQVNKKFNMEITIINTTRLFKFSFFHIALICVSMQSIGYATLAKLDPQYGLCK